MFNTGGPNSRPSSTSLVERSNCNDNGSSRLTGLGNTLQRTPILKAMRHYIPSVLIRIARLESRTHGVKTGEGCRFARRDLLRAECVPKKWHF